MELKTQETQAVAIVPPPTLLTRIRGFLRASLGIDRAIAFTVLARLWSSSAGLVTLALIARFLTPAQQGYYYLFGSIVALQIVFELGFSVVILQMASHESAHLTLSLDGQISGDPISHQRLASVLQRSIRWYSTAAVLMTVCLLPIGIRFFRDNHADTHVKWLLPWCLVVLASGLTFQIDPIFSFMEGCGYVSKIAKTRLGQSIAGSILAWGALSLHHGLFAPGLIICGQALVGIAFVLRYRKLLLNLFRHPARDHRITFREVWPFQWRIAVSWISGYFIFQLFNPVLFKYWGPVAAGQMGMTLTISGAISAISMAWVNTKAAPFGQMIARKEFAKLDHVFFRALPQSVGLCFLGCLTVWSTVFYLHLHHSPYANRVVSVLPLAMLFLVTTTGQITFGQAVYLRAHKHEKFLINSVVGAICMALSTILLGRRFGILGMASGYLATSLIVGVGFGTWTFFKYRRIWHST
jgi:O-antigen/teichoic acid export membrane protein